MQTSEGSEPGSDAAARCITVCVCVPFTHTGPALLYSLYRATVTSAWLPHELWIIPRGKHWAKKLLGPVALHVWLPLPHTNSLPFKPALWVVLCNPELRLQSAWWLIIRTERCIKLGNSERFVKRKNQTSVFWRTNVNLTYVHYPHSTRLSSLNPSALLLLHCCCSHVTSKNDRYAALAFSCPL